MPNKRGDLGRKQKTGQQLAPVFFGRSPHREKSSGFQQKRFWFAAFLFFQFRQLSAHTCSCKLCAFDTWTCLTDSRGCWQSQKPEKKEQQHCASLPHNEPLMNPSMAGQTLLVHMQSDQTIKNTATLVPARRGRNQTKKPHLDIVIDLVLHQVNFALNSNQIRRLRTTKRKPPIFMMKS